MNSGFTAITDNGGSSDDLSNLVVLLTEMRANVGSDFIISLSVGRDSSHWADALSDIDGYVVAGSCSYDVILIALSSPHGK